MSGPKDSYSLDPTIICSIPWFTDQLLAWFSRHGRRFPWREPGRSIYEIVIAEILLQRTPAPRVSLAYENFLDTYPNWDSLSSAKLEDLQTMLKPLGIWRRKADALISLSKCVDARGGSLPASRDELEALPGVGQYIASAVLLSHGLAEPLLDVNMARVLERLFGPRSLVDIRYDPYLQALSRRFVEAASARDRLHINWAVLDFGALICRSRSPLCDDCPLNAKCRRLAESGKLH